MIVLTQLHLMMQNPIVHGAISGAVGAAGVDILAFRKWQTWHDATSYSWSVASFRWFQGAVLGALMAFGLGVI